MLLRAAVLLLAFAMPPTGSAQSTVLKFDRITTEQGLSDNYVMAILQDRHGYMWIGTRDGLNRFNGNSFTQFRHDPENPQTIADGSINCLFEDSDGVIWAGTHGGGLNRYDRASETFARFIHDPADPASVGPGSIRSICEDTRGRLWLATEGPASGVSVMNRSTGRCERMLHDARDPWSLSNNHITAVCRDSAGSVWVMTFDGCLNRWDESLCGFVNRNTAPAYQLASPKSYGYALTTAPGGQLWAKIERSFLIVEPNARLITRYRTIATYDTAAYAYNPVTVFHDRDGRLWVGSFGAGIELSDSARGSNFLVQHDRYNANSLSSNTVFCITSDDAGNIWVGTDVGVNKLNRRNWQFQYFQHNPADRGSISPSVVRSILLDSSQTMWVATSEHGVDMVDRSTGRARHFRQSASAGSISTNFANTLYRDRRGVLWVGTNYGLNRFNGADETFAAYRHDDADTSTIGIAGVWPILEDRRGNFWVGTLGGGLNLFDRETGRAKHYVNQADDTTTLSHDYVLTLFEDRSGRLWVGTDGGLNLFDRETGRFTHYRNRPGDSTSLSNNRVWYIHEDGRGMLWLATSGGGVDQFDPATGRCRRLNERNGLANNTATSIVEDSHGRIWVATNKGMTRLDPSTWETRTYTAADGLLINQFHFKSCAMDSAGWIYFGGSHGIVMFHPDSLDENRMPPRLALTSFTTIDTAYRLDSAIGVKRHIQLEHANNFFTIEFAAFDFTNPQRNRFRYRLEEFDADWRLTDGTRPFANYTNVPPGTYRFRLAAANNDGFWNDSGLTLMIDIQPAFWQTWWFRLCCLLALIAAIAGAVVLRMREVRRKARLEHDLVEYQLQALRAQMNPHFIFNSLNSILHFIIGHDSESAHRYLSKFSKLIRATLEGSKSDTVALASELESLRLYLELESLRFDSSFEFSIDVQEGLDANDIEIPPMIIQPYAENAIKHGLAHRNASGRLAIDIRREGDNLLCSITDNGIGRARAMALQRAGLREHQSYGMEVTRRRLEALGSRQRQRYSVTVIDLYDGDEAKGTRVEVRIPID